MSALGSLSERQYRLSVAVFVIYCFAGAVQIVHAHTGHGIVGGIIYSTLLGALCYWLLVQTDGERLPQIFASLAPWIVLLTILGALDQWHNLKVQDHEPMTTSLALELPARALLLHGHELYSVTANGAAVSPGPGWILFWSPITVPGLTGAMDAIALAAFAVVLYRRRRVAAGLFVCLMLIQPLFLSQMANGQDLFIISIALSALILLLDEFDADWQVALLGLWGGVIATARLPIVAFICVIGMGLWKRNRQAATVFMGVALPVAACLHGAGWYFAQRHGQFYQPLHVLARAANSGGVPRGLAMALLFAGGLILIWKIRATAITWLLSVFFLMCLLFTPEGIGEYLLVRRWDWEGAVYISFPIPLLLTAIVLTTAHGAAERNTRTKPLMTPA